MPKLFNKKEAPKAPENKDKVKDEHDFIRKEFEEYFKNPKNNKFEKILKDGDSKPKKKDFQLTLNLPEYKPEEVLVAANGNVVEVKGKHQEKDEKGELQTVRSFIKSFSISEDCDVSQLKSKFEKDGVLTISAPRKTDP
ncbi:alpha-crystallin B chain-like [Coccinella septempunctata]|uniref:alpha-crystallin B chain-like n=1 Tax=Coccinella septempunctata TaxID=41139 RepID=UPI001D07E719|nr:alpha-crystallin B chain-like [Coccinella septempunctata]